MDDLTITVKGGSKYIVIMASTSSTRASWDCFTKRLGLPFSVKKMFIVASKEEIAKGVARSLKVPTDVVQDEARRLGVDFCLLGKAGKRQGKVTKERMKRHQARWALLRSYRRISRGPLIFQAGLLPGTLYGTDCYKPEAKFPAKLRNQWWGNQTDWCPSQYVDHWQGGPFGSGLERKYGGADEVRQGSVARFVPLEAAEGCDKHNTAGGAREGG